jgi:hypothetical protein
MALKPYGFCAMMAMFWTLNTPMSSARGGISAFQISGWVQAHPYCYITGQRESAGAKAQIFVGPRRPD